MTFTATIFNIDVNGTQTPNDANDNLVAAHIHAGPVVTPTLNGPVVWGFFGAPFNDNSPNDFTMTAFTTGVGGTFSGKWDLAEGNNTTLTAQLPNILAGPLVHQLPHDPVHRRRDPRQHRDGSPRARDLRADARWPRHRRRRRAAAWSTRVHARGDLTGRASLAAPADCGRRRRQRRQNRPDSSAAPSTSLDRSLICALMSLDGGAVAFAVQTRRPLGTSVTRPFAE